MAVTYKRIDGELVSAQWLVVLLDMRRAGVAYRVNEGKRTFQRQQYFYSLYLSGRGNLAAVPSHNAPHIRTGRIDHAIDFWNDVAVFSWLSRHGLEPRRTVRGESWHVEVPAALLRAYAARHGASADPLRALKGGDRRAADRLLYHRREMAREKRTGEGRRFRRQLKFSRRWKNRIVKRMNDLHSRGYGDSPTYRTLDRVIKATTGKI